MSELNLCRNCGEYELRDGLCARCLVLAHWLRNEDINRMGIFDFFREVIPNSFKNFQYSIPFFHKEILWEALRNEPGWSFNDRKVAIAAPRGSSKTTLLSKGLVLFCACFGLKKYIVLASKTGRASEKNMRWLRQALGSSSVIKYFGDLRPNIRSSRLEVDEVEGIWSKSIIALKNGVTIEALGMGQQLRSAAEGESVMRIDLFLADDTETNENTRTPDRRETNEEWLFETVLPSLDVDTGTIVFINTLAHSESILAKLLKSTGWRKRFYQITQRNAEGKEVSIWPEKFSLKTIESIRNDYALVGRLRSFYKEYYNIIQSEAGFSDRWFRYYEGEIFQNGGRNWLRFRTDGSQLQAIVVPVYMTLGIDLAFTFTENSDWTVLLPLATTHDNRRFVLPYVRARMSTYDDIDETGYQLKKGIVDEVRRLQTTYHFDTITIGANAPDLVTINLISDMLKEFERPPRVIPFVASRATGDKLQRNKDLLQPQYEIGRMHHIRGMHELETELIAMGDSTDDIADALHNAVKNAKTPEYLEYSPIMLPRDRQEQAYRVEHPRRVNWMVL